MTETGTKRLESLKQKRNLGGLPSPKYIGRITNSTVLLQFCLQFKLKINVELSVAQHETNVPVKCKAPRGFDVQSHVGLSFPRM